MRSEGAHGVPGKAQKYLAPFPKPSRLVSILSAARAARIGLLSFNSFPSE